MAPLQPLQQTVFEQGPQTPAVPTAEPAFVYQEGQVILPEPINPAVAIDPGINWYGLGEQAMGTAQKLLTETWDYLIETKENGLRDLGDQYQTKLDNAYMRLSSLQTEAQRTGRPANNLLVTGLIEQIKEVKKEWQKESRNVLGVGEKPNFLDPKVNVFDANMSDLGLKYQRLGLVAKGTERDIDNQAEKLLFQAQLLGITQEENDRSLQNFRLDNGKSPENADKIRAGRPFSTWEDIKKTNLFLDQNGKIVKDSQGIPYLIVNEDQTVSLNPDANMYDSPVKDEWAWAMMDIGHNKWEDSAVGSFTGVPNKEYTERFLSILDQDFSMRNPAKVREMAMFFSMYPPAAIETFANTHNLSTADAAYIGSVATLFRHGQLGADALKRPMSWLNNKNMEAASRILTAARGAGFAGGRREVIGVEAGTMEETINNYMLPIFAKYLGIVDEDKVTTFQEQYAIEESEVGNRIYIVDQESEEGGAVLLEDLLQNNPQLQYVMTSAIAYMLGNQKEFGSVVNGQFQFDAKKVKEAVEYFSQVLSGSTGSVISKDSAGGPVSAFNRDLAAAVNPTQSRWGNKVTASAWLASSYSAMDADTGFSMMRQMFKPDRQVYSIVANSLGVVSKTKDNERVGGKLPMSEHIRLAVASDPMTWLALKNIQTDSGQNLLTIEQAEKLSINEKLRYTRAAMEKMAPAHLWDVETLIEPEDNGFVGAGAGGLPIRIVGIRDAQGNPWLNGENPIMEIIADKTRLYRDYSYLPRNNNGEPLLFIPSNAGQKTGLQRFGEDLYRTGEQVSSGLVPYDLMGGSNTINSSPLKPITAVERAIVPTPEAEITPFLEETFPTNEGTPLVKTPQELIRYMSFNLQGVKDLPKLDPLMEETITYFVKDFAKLSTKKSQFFSEEMLSAILAKGQAQGFTSNAQYVGLMLSAVAHKLQNKQTTTSEVTQTETLTPEQKQFIDDMAKTLQSGIGKKNATVRMKKMEEAAKKQASAATGAALPGVVTSMPYSPVPLIKAVANAPQYWGNVASTVQETYSNVDETIPGPSDISRFKRNLTAAFGVTRESMATAMDVLERATTALYMNYYDEKPTKLELGSFLLNLLTKDLNPSALPPVKK